MRKLAVLFLLLPVFVSAGPQPAIRYLINEPASLMDLGLFALDQSLDVYAEMTIDDASMHAKTDIRVYGFNSTYNAEKERIEVQLKIVPKELSHAVSACHNILRDTTLIVVMQFVTESFGHRVKQPTPLEKSVKERLTTGTYLYCEAQTLDGETLALVSADLDSFETTTVEEGGY